jgi:Ca-activated chloride channel family protein
MAAIPVPSAAQDFDRQHPLMIVYDASGSMGQYVDGRIPGRIVVKLPIKRTLAVQTTTLLLDRLRPYATNLSVGLTLFGHRHRNDCTDIEVVRRVAPLTKPETTDALARIVREAEPKGRTPLMASIRTAIESVDRSQHPVTVVVVTDGEDECGMPPCETIDAIRADVVNLVVHIIGLQSNSRHFEAVRCVAERTGGLALRIKDPSEVESAVTRLAELLGNRTVLVRAPPTGVLRARSWIDLGTNAEFKGTVPVPTMHVRKADGTVVEGLETITGGVIERALPPGDYTVGVRIGAFDKDFKITVYAAQKTEFELPIIPGAIIARVIDAQGVSAEIEVDWEVRQMKANGFFETSPYRATARELRLRLPPGKYRVVAKFGERAVYQEATVEAERQVDLRLRSQ